MDYYDGETKYSVRFPKKRGPCPFFRVEHVRKESIREVEPDSFFICASTQITDLTEEIRKFAGPCHNFHGIQTTPKMLGYDSLTFYFRTGNVVTFTAREIIELQYPIR